MDFSSPLSMKEYVDQWMDAGKEDNFKEWDLRKSTKLARIHVRWRGSDVDPDYPIIRAEHFFPDVDDPRIILACINDFKKEWDKSASIWHELEEFRSKNCFVVCVHQKSVLKTAVREMFDKKIIFTAQDALDEYEDPKAELDFGSPDDIYMWVTEAPNELLEIKPGNVRIHSHFGCTRIGRMSTRPYDPTMKDQPEVRGVYLHCYS